MKNNSITIGGRDLPESLQMLPITQRRLAQDASNLRLQEEVKLKLVGQEGNDGDADDDTTFREGQREANMLSNEAAYKEYCVKHAEMLSAPIDNTTVSTGHMVEVNYGHKPEDGYVADSLYHILGPLDAITLDSYINGTNDKYEEEGIISSLSPLGKALIGLTTGAMAKFTVNNREITCFIGSNESSIQTSYFFNLKEI